MLSTLHDLRSSFRSLTRDPTSAIIAVVTLALGIGLCTVAFSIVYGVFLRGLDIPEADRVRIIARINAQEDGDNFMSVTQHDFYDWRAQQTSFEGLASYSGGNTMNLSDSLGPERFEGSYVAANMFDLLRVRPVIGSNFHPDDEQPGAPLKVILAYSVWKNRYGSNPRIVGRPVKINAEPATVIGVMPEGFMFPADRLLWVQQRDQRASVSRGGGVSFQVAGRLRDGVSWDRAQSEMSTIAAGIAREYPQTNERIGVIFRTFVEDDTGPEIIAVFSGMQVATIFVLLIACANVANLLLARATLRTRDAAVRTAIGGSPFRVVLPYFAETAILAAGGAILGMAIAWAGVDLFDRATQNVGKPYYMIFALDGPILAFVAGVAVLTTLVAGAAPALHVLRTNVNSTLKDESRGTSGARGGRVSRALVVAQVALSCALLVGAGLMIKSLARLQNYDYAFATENVFTGRVALFETAYPDTASRRQFWRSLYERVSAMPGAVSAALTTTLPGSRGGGRVAIEGKAYATDEEYPEAGAVVTTPGMFRTFNVTLLQGRDFSELDQAGALPVAIINQEFANRLFPDVDPIGRRIRPGTSQSRSHWLTIVGVAPSLAVRGLDLDNENMAEYYMPIAQRDPRSLTIAVRVAARDAMSIAPAVREVMRSIDPDQPVFEANSMLGAIEQETWFFRVFGTLFIVFGAAALFMASVGLYGVLAFSVTRRVREMGIRMALGANARDVIRLVLRQGAAQTAIGLTIGLAIAFGLSGPLQIIMFEIQPRDPLVFLSIALVILAVGIAASWVPARRATRVDPIIALRYE